MLANNMRAEMKEGRTFTQACKRLYRGWKPPESFREFMSSASQALREYPQSSSSKEDKDPNPLPKRERGLGWIGDYYDN